MGRIGGGEIFEKCAGLAKGARVNVADMSLSIMGCRKQDGSSGW